MGIVARVKSLFSRKPIQARFDLAQTTSQNRKHWANADGLSARAALSPGVRRIVRLRSRYEAENNSWYAGILRTAATHIVGPGPRLQVQGGTVEQNRWIELQWHKWAKRVKFHDVLRTAVEAYWRDGSSILMRFQPQDLLDVLLLEVDQLGSPFTQPAFDPYVDDGIRFDPATNELAYFIYDHHPGGNVPVNTLSGRWYPSTEVAHLYRAERPGQVHGIPRATPALQTLPIMRRQELATLLAAETAASFATFLKTNSPAVTPGQMEADFAEIEIARNMLMTLPEGWDIAQVDPKHPGPSYEMFQNQALVSFSRCTNMPFHLAKGSGMDSNFSSMKGDIRQLWAPEVAVEQERIESDVMTKVFQWFLEWLVIQPGSTLPPLNSIVAHWRWPPIPDVDPIDTANTVALRLSTGQTTPSSEMALSGKDWEFECKQAATDYGVDVMTLKRSIFAKTFGIQTDGNAPVGAMANASNQSSPATYADMGQRSFRNNATRIPKILQDYIDGGSEVVARTLLQNIGLNGEQIDALIADAEDGRIDNEEVLNVN